MFRQPNQFASIVSGSSNLMVSKARMKDENQSIDFFADVA